MRWPTEAEMRESAMLLERNSKWGFALREIFGTMDGARTPCVDYGDANLQNAFYEGRACSEEITNMAAFNFHGEIILAGVSFPGVGMTVARRKPPVCMILFCLTRTRAPDMLFWLTQLLRLMSRRQTGRLLALEKEGRWKACLSLECLQQSISCCREQCQVSGSPPSGE